MAADDSGRSSSTRGAWRAAERRRRSGTAAARLRPWFVLALALAAPCMFRGWQAQPVPAGAGPFAAAAAEAVGMSADPEDGVNGADAASVLLFERADCVSDATAEDAEHGAAAQNADAAGLSSSCCHGGALLRLTGEGRKFLAGLRPPFAFVSAVGDTRTGKSTLLGNAFLDGDHGVFQTGTGVVSHTRGVHATKVPKIVPREPYGDVNVYFIDTEGFHGVETLVSKTYEANLFSFMTLLSSSLVYTSFFPLNANDVHRMKSFAALANLFFTFSDLHDSELRQLGHDGGTESDPNSEKFAATQLAIGKRPRLIWAVQDFNLANLANSGRTVHELLDTLLSGTLLGRKDMDLQLLRSMFSDIRLVPIPRPSNDDGVLASMDRLTEVGYLPGYKEALESLSKAALESITPIAFEDGRPMSGQQFLKAFNWWVDGEGLEVEERSTWLSTVLSKLEVSGRGHAHHFRRYAETLLSERVQLWQSQREAIIAEAARAGRHLPVSMSQERLEVFARSLAEFREAEAARLGSRITRLGLEPSKVSAYAQFTAVDGPNIQFEFEDAYVRRALEEHEHVLDALVSRWKASLESLLATQLAAKLGFPDAGKSADNLGPVLPPVCEVYWLRVTLLSRLERERKRALSSFNVIAEAKGLPHERTAKEATDDQRRRLAASPALEALEKQIQLEYDACPNMIYEHAVRRPARAASLVLAPHARFLADAVLLPLSHAAFAYLLPASTAAFAACVVVGQVRRALPGAVRRASALAEYGLTAAIVGAASYGFWRLAGGKEAVAGALREIQGQLAAVGAITILWVFWRSRAKSFA